MRIAHLILAHKNPAQLQMLISVLDHPAFDFYIHVDKKVDEMPFRSLVQKKNVFFLEKRAKIYWGGWGTIQATLNGFEYLIPKEYDYINVISAQDFPIKSPEYIHRYFSENRGKEFITCDRIEGDWKDVASRIENYHLINWTIPGKHKLEKVLTWILPPRVFPLNLTVVGRANWFSLTNDAAKYAVNFLKLHPEVVRYFKYCWGADEFIFSTILYNSQFKEKICNNLVYVNWSGKKTGHPKLLDSKDFNELKLSDKLFARKFDLETDDGIFKLLKDLVSETNKTTSQT